MNMNNTRKSYIMKRREYIIWTHISLILESFYLSQCLNKTKDPASVCMPKDNRKGIILIMFIDLRPHQSSISADYV